MNEFYEKIPKDVLNELPIRSFEGDIFFVDNEKDFKKVLPVLKDAGILGFDTETRPAFKKGITYDVALLQLATSDKAFLFKLDKLRLPNQLINILEDKTVIKTGVAIRDDLKALQKLRKFTPGAFVELQTFSDKYKIEDNGLKNLSGNLLGFRISKSAKLTDWSKDVYTEAQLKYAATDAWVSYEIYLKLLSLNGNFKIIENGL
ncbi:MAG: 3'-5' exonuclease domain-containing protein 2 [Bacteroidetes bacterium]|nr:MAG: 3'-5' exonuclease domain-containing protein 2 [Bacteroidota bacterium]